MQDLKNKAEAVLFMTGRFMAVEDIATFCNVGSVGLIKDALQALAKDYTQRNCGLEVIEQGGKYKLDIRKDYHSMTTRLVSSSELDAPTQATLALIAYKQPALQADIVKMRGNSAYDHIQALKSAEFVTSERKGRTRVLKLTGKFFDYFNIVEEELKDKMRTILEKQQVLEEKHEEKKDVAEKKEIIEEKEIAPRIEDLVPAEKKEIIPEPAEKPQQENVPLEKEKPSENKPRKTKEKKTGEPVVDVIEQIVLEEQKRTVPIDADDFGTPLAP